LRTHKNLGQKDLRSKFYLADFFESNCVENEGLAASGEVIEIGM
jgi:hypothetical protein